MLPIVNGMCFSHFYVSTQKRFSSFFNSSSLKWQHFGKTSCPDFFFILVNNSTRLLKQVCINHPNCYWKGQSVQTLQTQKGEWGYEDIVWTVRHTCTVMYMQWANHWKSWGHCLDCFRGSTVNGTQVCTHKVDIWGGWILLCLDVANCEQLNTASNQELGHW